MISDLNTEMSDPSLNGFCQAYNLIKQLVINKKGS